jgi:dihydroorotate dehydrogenase electron transfer subunit
LTATLELGRVTKSVDAAPGVGLLAFASPPIARAYAPGLFVHVKTGDASTILRRPFSIARVVGEEIVLLYRIIGSGTEWMRRLQPGDTLDAMGPLGQGFALRTRARRILLVGGGLGIAPLLGLAESLYEAGTPGRSKRSSACAAAATSSARRLTDGLDRLVWHLATDDGTEGFHGNAVELLRKRLDELAAEDGADGLALYAAGPEPMLEATAKLCVRRGLDLQVSMEAHMGCGVGACRACGIVTWKDSARLTGRVCKEGPVFDADEILWEEVGR